LSNKTSNYKIILTITDSDIISAIDNVTRLHAFVCRLETGSRDTSIVVFATAIDSCWSQFITNRARSRYGW